ncbi:hypothetical protein [Listeria seeligeri]|uniref:hypothetical protein n=1 Tax=Listeria seeligeri TaxID=1640 RepID=UPI0018885100|nr:hypothetical protein [Listeria seeligeri]MBF2653924.1 hypothetical protein [Listeria seeligeri]
MQNLFEAMGYYPTPKKELEEMKASLLHTEYLTQEEIESKSDAEIRQIYHEMRSELES